MSASFEVDSTDGVLHKVRSSPDLLQMHQEMAPVKKALIAADLPKLKSELA